MKKLCFIFLLSSGLMAAFSGKTIAGENQNPPPAYKNKTGPYQVLTLKENWHDSARDRNVPVKIYYPQSTQESFPVLLFSHGLGGSRDGYEFLGNHWASHGYISVHVQHLGSDSAVWQESSQPMQNMKQAILDPQNLKNRPLDIHFAMDQLTRMNQGDSVLKNRMDLDHAGIAGHSFGAYTALSVAGESFDGLLGKTISFVDPRFKSAIIMSAPAPHQKDHLDSMFDPIHIPCMHMTGTLDDSPIGDTKAAERRIPYDQIHGADQYLIIFKGGDHMIFSGRYRLKGGESDPLFHDLILMSSTAFWDATLKHSSVAKKFLDQGDFMKILDSNGTLESKHPAK